MAKKFEVKQLKSVSGCTDSQRRTLTALGLRKRLHTVVLEDNPANRGQILKVQHLVSVKVLR